MGTASSSLRVVVSGLIAQYPLGGVTWDYVQYVAGLAQLGHDVYYIEDSGQWPYNPHEDGVSKTCDFNVTYLATVMARFGLADRWAYRFPWQSQWFGLSDAKRTEVIESADVVLNVSGSLGDPADYGSAARLVYIDSDPVFTQVKLARGQADLRAAIDLHDVRFSFGERLSAVTGASVPDSGYEWLPTRQPIVLDEWVPVTEQRPTFTTIMNWSSYKPLIHEGQRYGQKDIELRRFVDLPSRASAELELAIALGKVTHTPHDLLRHRGWRLVDPAVACPDLDSYRDYIRHSRAEWTVAKHGYVAGAAGWFSCRSACYLAAGRPVVVQDTGFRSTLPTGVGVIPFSDLDEAVDGIASVQSDYRRHAAGARDIAAAFFDHRHVLTDLLERAHDTTATSVSS